MLRSKLRIGLHWDVEVTDDLEGNRPLVSQAYASLVLLATYEASLWVGVLNVQRGLSNIALLTRPGGGALGIEDHWIDAAMRRGLQLAAGFGLNVRSCETGRSRELRCKWQRILVERRDAIVQPQPHRR